MCCERHDTVFASDVLIYICLYVIEIALIILCHEKHYNVYCNHNSRDVIFGVILWGKSASHGNITFSQKFCRNEK